MNRSIKFLLLATAFLSPLSFADSSSTEELELNEKLALFAKQHGSETPEDIRSAHGKLGATDATAVLFVLEKDMRWEQYLAISWKTETGIAVAYRKVGGKAFRFGNSVYVERNAVKISGRTYEEGKDAMCCPSKPFRAYFHIRDGRISAGRVLTSQSTGPARISAQSGHLQR